jgi:hypothetical protein
MRPRAVIEGPGTTMRRLRQAVSAVATRSALLLYSSSNLAVQATLLVCQVWVLRYLPPTQIGIYQSTLVISTYLAVANLGVINGMNREYPVLLGEGSRERASAILSTAQIFALACGALQALLFIVLALSLKDESGTWRLACLTVAACAPLRHYTSYLLGVLRAHQEFRQITRIQFAQVFVYPLLVLLPRHFGYVGFCGREVLSLLLPAIAYHCVRPAKARPFFEWSAFRCLFDTGWRLYLQSFIIVVAESGPRTVRAVVGGPVLLALFVPVNWMLLGISGVSGSISIYLYPRLAYRFGRQRVAVARISLRASLMTFLILAPFAAMGFFLVPLLLPVLLPQYASSATAARIALLSGLFDCASIATMSFSIARAWKAMASYLALVLPIRVACAIGGFFAAADHVEGVAMGALIGSIVMVPVTWMTVRHADARWQSRPLGEAS